tara:strand:+ start:3184 stop:3807 length:624 start_codon:yes stop_codon:yes gene_type:complete
MATYEATRYSTTGANIPSNTIPATSVVDGTVSNTEFAYINSLSSNAQTQITASVPKAGATMTGSLVFPDSTGPAPAFIAMGAGTDIKVSSDGTSGLVIGNALEMQSTTAEKYLTAAADGAVDVYHNNVKKFETSAAGVTVTGIATATTFSGSGASLTSLPAANVTGQLAASTGSTGITIDYDNLPSSDPGVKGRFWRNGLILNVSAG